MGTIRVHEFTSLYGVIDAPTWPFDYGFDPTMGKDIGNLMSSCEASLLGRNTYEMFEPAWSARPAEEDPDAPFMNDSTKYVVSSPWRKEPGRVPRSSARPTYHLARASGTRSSTDCSPKSR